MIRHISFAEAHRGALLLVNDRRPLSVWPEETALVSVGADAAGRPVLLRRDAARMLGALLDTVHADGAIVPVSGWRAHAEQEALYADCLRAHGEAFTQAYVALPGCSEHETGLAIDVGEAREEIDFIRPAFPDTGVCGAFRRAAAQCGFIERYPADAREITHIGAEPWHFRYIGVPHAALMTAQGVTLEEYTEQLMACTPAHPLRTESGGRTYTIFRVPLTGAGASFETPEGMPYQASADNCGGLVVTVWGAA